MSKGSDDNRSPDYAARASTYERVHGVPVTLEELLRFLSDLDGAYLEMEVLHPDGTKTEGYGVGWLKCVIGWIPENQQNIKHITTYYGSLDDITRTRFRLSGVNTPTKKETDRGSRN